MFADTNTKLFCFYELTEEGSQYGKSIMWKIPFGDVNWANLQCCFFWEKGDGGQWSVATTIHLLHVLVILIIDHVVTEGTWTLIISTDASLSFKAITDAILRPHSVHWMLQHVWRNGWQWIGTVVFRNELIEIVAGQRRQWSISNALVRLPMDETDLWRTTCRVDTARRLERLMGRQWVEGWGRQLRLSTLRHVI